MLLKKTKWSILLLAVWLIATGVLQLVAVTIPYIHVLLAAIAIAAGILLLMDR